MKKLLFLLLSSVLYGEVIVSPNMNLPVPIVSQTTGPEWANDINACMSGIDSHDHTPGKGVPISSQALSISTDLPLNNNSLTSTKAVVFSSQASFATNQSIYSISPDLYYNDGNGNVIRITQSGSVSGASGTITGLPSGTASASYQPVGGTFRFQSATNTPANIDGASFIVREQVTSVTPTGITIKVPSGLAASYNLTLPASVPSFTSLLTMGTSGSLSTVPYHAPTVQKIASGTGTYTLPTGPSPIYINVKMVGGGGGGGSSDSGAAASTGGTTYFRVGASPDLLVANGGEGGVGNAGGAGTGGTASLGTGPIGVAITGGGGGAGTNNSQTAGGIGGSAPYFSGAGRGGINAIGGGGVTNTGGGGGGASRFANASSGAGGGSGGFVDAIINSPSATYAYSIGIAGTGGAAGGNSGGDGGSGYIVVTEIYQ